SVLRHAVSPCGRSNACVSAAPASWSHRPPLSPESHARSGLLFQRDRYPSPLREPVQPGSVSDLSLAFAVRPDGKKLEAAGRDDSVEGDLPAVERPRGCQIADGVVGELSLAGAVRVHHAELEVRAALSRSIDNPLSVRRPRRRPLFFVI